MSTEGAVREHSKVMRSTECHGGPEDEENHKYWGHSKVPCTLPLTAYYKDEAIFY